MRRFACYTSLFAVAGKRADCNLLGTTGLVSGASRSSSTTSSSAATVDIAVLRCVGLHPQGLLANLQQALGHQSDDVASLPQLQGAIAQLRQLNIPEQELSDTQTLLAKLSDCAERDETAKSTYQLLIKERQQAALSGNAAVLASLTRPEVQALSGQQFRQLQARIQRLQQHGRQLVASILQPHRAAPPPLTPDDVNAIAWHLRSEPAAAQPVLQRLQASRATLASAADRPLREHQQQAAAQQLLNNLSIESELAAMSGLVPPRVLGHELVDPALEAQLGMAATSAPDGAEGFVGTVQQLEKLVSGQVQVSLSLPSPANLQREVQAQLAAAPQLLQQLLADVLGPEPQSAAELRCYQSRVAGLLEALAQELAQEEGGQRGGPAPFWAPDMGMDSAGGMHALMQLLGERGPEVAAMARDAARTGEARGGLPPADKQYEDSAGNFQVYEALEGLHGDQDVQRYLQMEFDPALEVNTSSAPRPWLDAEAAALGEEEFLAGMRPALDAYLQACGAAPLEEGEWEAYSAAAIDEFRGVRGGIEGALKQSGHSGFFNARAEEAYLRTRLAAAVPKDNVLHAAGHKYLSAVLRNTTWTFAQRLAMVDRLAELAGHLGKVPTRVRGSPYSAVFSGQVPLVPRLSRERRKLRRDTAYVVPPQFQQCAAQLPAGRG